VGQIAEAIVHLAAETPHHLDQEWDGVGSEVDRWEGKV
jgi:hypothetical protein